MRKSFLWFLVEFCVVIDAVILFALQDLSTRGLINLGICLVIANAIIIGFAYFVIKHPDIINQYEPKEEPEKEVVTKIDYKEKEPTKKEKKEAERKYWDDVMTEAQALEDDIHDK